MPPYSRANPSPDFLHLQELYRQMHSQGDQASGAKAGETFDGRSLAAHVPEIKAIKERWSCESLLDYGAGKAKVHFAYEEKGEDGEIKRGIKQALGFQRVWLYDPGYPPIARLPDQAADMVVSTDVLEHIPADDIPWVLAEMFSFAKKATFLTIALYPAAKILPDGQNAHVTLKSVGWWADRLEDAAQTAPHLAYQAELLYAYQGGRKAVLSAEPALLSR